MKLVYVVLLTWGMENSLTYSEMPNFFIPFERSYPQHIRAKKVSGKIKIDGKLDEMVWITASWEDKFVDIKKHANDDLNQVPLEFQSKVAVVWDDTYLYIGAKLKEPFLYGKIEGHNLEAPYHDNDFEVFVDVSGTNYYYKEFEINALNATYDVNWGVPDQAGLKCDSTQTRLQPYVPVCVNTSFPGYKGNWTMKATKERIGLQTATSYKKDTFGKFSKLNEWTVEMAFPITRSEYHGGLLDTEGDKDEYYMYHPKTAPKNFRRYWWIDFARAEHPRFYKKGAETTFCPNDCKPALALFNATKENPDADQCKKLKEKFPTLIGDDPTYGCYFEWVFEDLGRRGAYMHRPQEWAILEFTEEDHDCRNIEYIGRHALKLIYYSQMKYKEEHDTYTDHLMVLTLPKYCVFDQDCKDLKTVMKRKDVFPRVVMNVVNNATEFDYICTTSPCFTAEVSVSIPKAFDFKVEYKARINENMHVKISHKDIDAVENPRLMCL